MMPIRRGLIEHDCLAPDGDCAANGGSCLCPRRWAGEDAPFPREGSGKRHVERVRAEPGPTLADVMPDALKRRAAG